MRKRIYEIIELSQDNDMMSKVYDIFMFILIIVSLTPLLVKEPNATLILTEQITVVFFIVDYILRLITADFKYDSATIKSFLKYPFSFLALIDLFSILPSLIPASSGIRFLKILRSLRLLKVLKVFKTLRYCKSVAIIIAVFNKSKEPLLTVCSLAISYILISALFIFNIEPSSFDTMFDAIYWATVSLTTMGYGDIYPVTTAGRVITMLSAFVGIAIVALPAGIITAGYMEEITSNR